MVDIRVMMGEDVRAPERLSEITVSVLMHTIKTSETLEEQIAAVRAIADKKERNALKAATLPYMLSGLFRGRRHTEAFIESSLFIIDVDHVGDYNTLFERVKTSAHTHFAFRSPSGDGLKVGIRLSPSIVDAKKYTIAYRDCADRFARYFGVEVDHTSDCARACFLGYDNDLYYSPHSMAWKPKTEEPIRSHSSKPYVAQPSNTDDEYNRCLALAQSATINDYQDWVDAGISLRTAFGDRGFDLFLALSLGKGHPDTRESLWQKWRSFPESSQVTLASFIFLAKKHGGRPPFTLITD